MSNWSLRARLTLWSALVSALALLTLAAVTTVGLYYSQLEGMDDNLAAEADLFFAALPAGAPAPAGRDLLRNHNEVLDGFAIGPTAGRATQVYPADIAPLTAAWPSIHGIHMAVLHGKRVRVGAFIKNERTLLLVADLESVRETLSALLWAYAVALPVVLLVVAAGSWWIAQRALQPIAAITAAASAITADKLHARLPVPPADDEIGRHIRVLNEMFDRLQRGFEQATRFTADASHELRTPLTILRGEIEESLRAGPDGTDQEKTLLSLLEQTDRLQKIADNLLLLSRFDAGKNLASLAPLDFSSLVTETVEDAELLAAPLGLTVSADVAPEVRVIGDPVLLRRALLNLVDNAVRYNRPGGGVRLALRREGATAVLALANTGSGIPAERRGELFQRFFRLDPARNRGTGGSGLGLSLCREIAIAHGGGIELARGEVDCTEFRLRLPVA